MDFINNPSSINKFIEEGYLFQLNGYSITGLFGKEAKKTAEILLKNNIYSFIGSDAHGVGKRNTSLSNVCKAIEEINNGSVRKFIDNGAKVINNDVVEFCGQKIEKKRGLFYFFKK